MKILVTGSSGHLGEALVRTLRNGAHEVTGLDRLAGRFTNVTGTIADRDTVREQVRGKDAIIHAATLHKPHVATHTRSEFIEINITGTINLLEEAVDAGIQSFIFTSTTSAFGKALTPPKSAPAAWITEQVQPVPKNIYGVTKVAAENMCELIHHQFGLACVILRISRFFPEEDDDAGVRNSYDDLNAKANEYLYRRVDLHDVVQAHLLALEKAASIGFGRYIISATSPFRYDDLEELRNNAVSVVERRVPGFADEYMRRGWKMFPGIDRVYVNDLARRELGWQPVYDFQKIIGLLKNGDNLFSPLAIETGSKGYHDRTFAEGPYPVSSDID